MTTMWVNRVAEEKPERFVTFTRCGQTRDEIRLGLQHIVQKIRKAGLRFEYWGVVELTVRRAPHIHLLQRGDYLPKAMMEKFTRAENWGFSDIRAIGKADWRARYATKHLSHSHGRRWDGRLIRYSRHFFNKSAKKRKEEFRQEGATYEVVFGRADAVAKGLRDYGYRVAVGEMGIDWIMGEINEAGFVKQKHERDKKKGYDVPYVAAVDWDFDVEREAENDEAERHAGDIELERAEVKNREEGFRC